MLSSRSVRLNLIETFPMRMRSNPLNYFLKKYSQKLHFEYFEAIQCTVIATGKCLCVCEFHEDNVYRFRVMNG